MAISITHSKVSGESNPDDESLIGGEDWDDEHIISGIPFNSLIGSTVRIPVLIETKNLTDSANCTFSDLNGDEDEEYFISIDGTFTVPSGNLRYFLYPNADTSHYDTISFGANDGGTPFRWNGDPFIIAAANTGGPVYCYTESNFRVKTGSLRKFISKTTTYRSGEGFIFHQGGFYTDTTTNITSLYFTVQVSGNLFTGTIKLYKMVDLTL